MDMESLCFQE